MKFFCTKRSIVQWFIIKIPLFSAMSAILKRDEKKTETDSTQRFKINRKYFQYIFFVSSEKFLIYIRFIFVPLQFVFLDASNCLMKNDTQQ